MVTMNSTEVRKNWSLTLDTVIREKPVYVKRTRDNVAILNQNTLNEILSAYLFLAKQYTESDGSITLSAIDLDIAVNAGNLDDAKMELAKDIKEYSEDFYNDFSTWSAARNRKKHIPYVLKALTLETKVLAEEIICQNGEN